MEPTIFSNNKARTGGAFWANGNSSLTAINITVYANFATFGGVIFIFSSNAFLCNSNFSYNGSLYLFNSNATITG